MCVCARTFIRFNSLFYAFLLIFLLVGWVLVFRIARVILYSIRFYFVGCVLFSVEFISISCLIVVFACDLVFFLSSLNFIATILSSIFSRQPNHHPTIVYLCSVFVSFSCHFTTNHINLNCCDGKILIFVWLFGCPYSFFFSHSLPTHSRLSRWVVLVELTAYGKISISCFCLPFWPQNSSRKFVMELINAFFAFAFDLA